MRSLLSDFRVALRNLRRRPGFTATAVVTLALGIGMNTLVFTWAKALVLRPLPGVGDAGRILYLSGSLGERRGISHWPAALEFYRNAGTKAFRDLAGFEFVEMALGGGERPEVIGGGVVSGNYFQLLEVRGAAGRLLESADDRPQAAPVAVLSARMARRLFGSESAAAGKTIRLRRQEVPVVGVADAAFGGTYGGLGQDVWVSIAGWQSLTGKPMGGIQILGRLAPGATRAAAAAEIHGLAQRLADSAVSNRGWDAAVLGPSESPRGFTGGVAPLIGILLVVVGLVLAIACANLAGLLLARAVERGRETAIRLSLGAERADLVRLQLTESLLLAVLGAAAGLLPARLLAGAIFGLLPLDGFSINLDLGIDATVLAATLVVTLLAAALSSAAPMLLTREASPATTLRSESPGAVGGRRKARLRAGLVAMQLALSLAATAAAAILVRATLAELAADPGFPRQGALVATVNLDELGYDAARGQRFLADAVERLATMPGAVSASVSSFVPMGVAGGGNGRRFELEGAAARPDEALGAVTDAIGPDYFRTLGIRVVRGRDLAAGDRAGSAPVALVTEAFERRYLPNGALGARLKLADEWREIVGVVADATYRSVREEKLPRVYVPVQQVYSGRMTFVVRGAGDSAALARSLRAVIATLDAELPLTAVESLATHAAAVSFSSRIAAILLSGLGLLALALAAVGLFGLLAYSVAARRRELGLRSALGATARSLVGLVARDGARLVGIGAAFGLLLALALGRLLASAFPGARTFDPQATAVALLILGTAAAAASVYPALRAARIDPSRVLREE